MIVRTLYVAKMSFNIVDHDQCHMYQVWLHRLRILANHKQRTVRYLYNKLALLGILLKT